MQNVVMRYVEIKCQLDATDDFYCRYYCLLNMFQAPLCPSSGAREYYTDGCCLWYLVLWFSSCRYGAELRVVCPVCGLLQHLLHLVGILFPHIRMASISTRPTGGCVFLRICLDVGANIKTPASSGCRTPLVQFACSHDTLVAMSCFVFIQTQKPVEVT